MFDFQPLHRMMNLQGYILSQTIKTSAARFMIDDNLPYVVLPNVVYIDVHSVFSQKSETFGYA